MSPPFSTARSRRSFLQLGGAGMATLGLGGLEQARALSAATTDAQSDTAVIFVWLPGGPPHMETYDMKPDAPVDYRGEFRPIHTNVPGIDVCELLPMHAKCADRFTLVRSVQHTFSDHGGGHKRFMTGRLPATPTGFVNDAPMVGSIASSQLQSRPRPSGLSDYVVLGNGRVNSIDTFCFGSAYLGQHTHPFVVSGDPSQKDFKVKNVSLGNGMVKRRLDDRVALLGSLDRLRHDVDSSGLMDSMDVFSQRAVSMVTSPKRSVAWAPTIVEPSTVPLPLSAII